MLSTIYNASHRVTEVEAIMVTNFDVADCHTYTQGKGKGSATEIQLQPNSNRQNLQTGIKPPVFNVFLHTGTAGQEREHCRKKLLFPAQLLVFVILIGRKRTMSVVNDLRLPLTPLDLVPVYSFQFILTSYTISRYWSDIRY